MFTGDIKLDKNGNTVIEDGNMVTTGGNYEFIVRSLKYGKGSWKTNTTFGFGIDKYLGRKLDRGLLKDIRVDMKSYFRGYNIICNVNLVPLNRAEVTGEIEFINENLDLTFYMDVKAGRIEILTEDDLKTTTDDITGYKSRETDNEYLNRR